MNKDLLQLQPFNKDSHFSGIPSFLVLFVHLAVNNFYKKFHHICLDEGYITLLYVSLLTISKQLLDHSLPFIVTLSLIGPVLDHSLLLVVTHCLFTKRSWFAHDREETNLVFNRSQYQA